MDSLTVFMMAALKPFSVLILRLVDYAPMVIAAILMLLIGMLFGRFIGQLVERCLNVVRLDDHLHKIGVPELLRRLGLGHSLTRLLGVLSHSIILLVTIVGASTLVQLTVVSEFLHRILDFGPRLIAVTLIMGGGLYLGHLVGHIVYRAAMANDVRGAEALSRCIHGLLVVFAGIIALEHLNIDVNIIWDYLQIVVAALGLGLAIAFGVAFGMAGRDMASRMIRDLMPGQSNSNGVVKPPRKIPLKRAA